jgi:hypothetical protein
MPYNREIVGRMIAVVIFVGYLVIAYLLDGFKSTLRLAIPLTLSVVCIFCSDILKKLSGFIKVGITVKVTIRYLGWILLLTQIICSIAVVYYSRIHS